MAPNWTPPATVDAARASVRAAFPYAIAARSEAGDWTVLADSYDADGETLGSGPSPYQAWVAACRAVETAGELEAA